MFLSVHLTVHPPSLFSPLSSLSLSLFTPVRNTPPPGPGPGVERAERHGDVKQHTHVIFAFHEFNASLPVSAITTTASIVKGGGEHYAKIYDAAHARDTVLCCNRRRTIRLRIGTRSTTFRKWIRDQIIRAVQDTHLITTSSFGGARKSRLTAHRSIMQLQTIMAKIFSFNRNIGNASFSICDTLCRRALGMRTAAGSCS